MHPISRQYFPKFQLFSAGTVPEINVIAIYQADVIELCSMNSSSLLLFFFFFFFLSLGTNLQQQQKISIHNNLQ